MGLQLIPPFYTLLDKDSKQGAQGPISHFCLAVGLGMPSHAKLKWSARFPSQSELKIAKELAIPIRNHGQRVTMESYNLSKVEISNVGSIIGGMARNEVSHFGETVHYHKD